MTRLLGETSLAKLALAAVTLAIPTFELACPESSLSTSATRTRGIQGTSAGAGLPGVPAGPVEASAKFGRLTGTPLFPKRDNFIDFQQLFLYRAWLPGTPFLVFCSTFKQKG
jgi:hypothetical protein